MPRRPNPNPPGRGNRSTNRGRPLRVRASIDRELAKQLRDTAPDIDLDVLIRTLLVQFITNLQDQRP